MGSGIPGTGISSRRSIPCMGPPLIDFDSIPRQSGAARFYALSASGAKLGKSEPASAPDPRIRRPVPPASVPPPRPPRCARGATGNGHARGEFPSLPPLHEGAKEIGLGDDPDKAAAIDHREPSYLVIEHQDRRLPRVLARAHDDGALRHYRFDAHSRDQVV